jgi:hypothetical protein
MCSLSYYAPGVPVDEQHLRNGAEVNDEGYGYALVADALYVGRSMDPGLLGEFAELRACYPDAPAVFHSRLSTGSAVTSDNIHPFTVAGDGTTVVFANGTLPYETRWLDVAGLCDTRVFAEESFPAIFSDLDDAVTFEMLTRWCTPANKMAIVTANPRYAEPVYLVNRDQFLVTGQGVLHSNSDHLGKGAGWDEQVIDGELYRWRLRQPGQCDRCSLFGCSGNCQGDGRLPAHRNETARRALVAGAPR